MEPPSPGFTLGGTSIKTPGSIFSRWNCSSGRRLSALPKGSSRPSASNTRRTYIRNCRREVASVAPPSTMHCIAPFTARSEFFKKDSWICEGMACGNAILFRLKIMVREILSIFSLLRPYCCVLGKVSSTKSAGSVQLCSYSSLPRTVQPPYRPSYRQNWPISGSCVQISLHKLESHPKRPVQAQAVG